MLYLLFRCLVLPLQIVLNSYVWTSSPFSRQYIRASASWALSLQKHLFNLSFSASSSLPFYLLLFFFLSLSISLALARSLPLKLSLSFSLSLTHTFPFNLSISLSLSIFLYLFISLSFSPSLFISLFLRIFSLLHWNVQPRFCNMTVMRRVGRFIRYNWTRGKESCRKFKILLWTTSESSIRLRELTLKIGSP